MAGTMMWVTAVSKRHAELYFFVIGNERIICVHSIQCPQGSDQHYMLL